MNDIRATLSLLFLITGVALFFLGLVQLCFDTNFRIPAFVMFAGAAFFGLLTGLMLARTKAINE